MAKYNIQLKGILHVGAHECEELNTYETYLDRSRILWVEAMPHKIGQNTHNYPGLLIEHAVACDTNGEKIIFNVSNNGQSSSILEFGTHATSYPGIVYTNRLELTTSRLENILNNPKYSNIEFLIYLMQHNRENIDYAIQKDYIETQLTKIEYKNIYPENILNKFKEEIYEYNP
jgi:hypothetical protein